MPSAIRNGTGKRDPSKRIPLRITDTTLRDAHQSLWATRMRTVDILPIVETMDAVGFYSLEVWGGATYDVCLRFLRENPWDRLREIKARAKKTPLQMLLRGQNILGYKNYPDDVLERFVALACENGIDIFRIFDALNDTRNLQHAIECVKRYGGHAQGTLSYTTSPVHTTREFVRVAKQQVAMGIDSLCVKDMAGILSPIAAEELVSALFKAVNVPIQLHCHATSGMAVASYVEGVRAGAGAIDCAISPMAGYQSQPPVETMLSIFEEMPYHATLDMDALRQVRKYFEELKRGRTPVHHVPENIIDPEILLHHIPGGMISNLRSQLVQQNALDRLNEVFEELPRVRKDMGYPPLVTPTSQIVGTQAVLNVLSGQRYSMIPQEVKDYVKGLYGRAPGKIDPELSRLILGKEKAVHKRPADSLKPMLPVAAKEIDPKLVQHEEDIISYCLFPEPALEYFKWRALPPAERPLSPADKELKDLADGQNVEPEMPQPKPFLHTNDYHAIRELLERAATLEFSELTIRRKGVAFSVKSETRAEADAAQHAAGQEPAAQVQLVGAASPQPDTKAAAEPVAPRPGTTVDSPLSGTFYNSPGAGKPQFAQPGDVVEEGSPVCIVEAMKLFNEVKTPCKCKVVEFLVEHGKPVEKGQPLVRIERLG